MGAVFGFDYPATLHEVENKTFAPPAWHDSFHGGSRGASLCRVLFRRASRPRRHLSPKRYFGGVSTVAFAVQHLYRGFHCANRLLALRRQPSATVEKTAGKLRPIIQRWTPKFGQDAKVESELKGGHKNEQT